jgi:hypothetical protein
MPSTKRTRNKLASTTRKSPPTSARSSVRKPLPAEDVLVFPDVPEDPRSDLEVAEDDAPRRATVYEDRYLAFIDILGFKELVDRSVKDGAATHESVASIFNALDLDFRGFENDFVEFQKVPHNSSETDLRVHTFSDFAVVSCRKTEVGLALLIFIAWRVSSDWLSKKYLSRGAIVRGPVLHRAGATGRPVLVFGPAFIEAYTLESQVADYPRVMLSTAVRRDFKDGKDNGSISTVQKLVGRCPDGPSCIDLFAHLRKAGFSFLGNQHRLEAQQFSEALDLHLEQAADTPNWYRKARWLAERFNLAIKETAYADLHQTLEHGHT